jgi:hypothetical protein
VTRSSGSWVRRSRPALGCDRFCADRDPRFAVFPLRPSSDRATDRRSSLAVQPSSGFRPGRLARLHGRLSWVFWPPSLHAFSAQRPGTFAGRRLHARGVSSMRSLPANVSSLGACLPSAMDACASPLLRFSCARPKSRARGAPESASPSEVASSFEAAIPFRGSWFVVVPPDEIHPTHVAIRRQGDHPLSTIVGTRVCIFLSRGCAAIRALQKFFTRRSTACGNRAPAQRMTRTRTEPRAQSRVARR